MNFMELSLKLGKVIRNLRQKRGWSQNTLSEFSEIDTRYISDIELGKRNVSLSVLEKISSAFNIDTNHLLFLAENLDTRINTISELRERLLEKDAEDTVVLENPNYIDAIIGISEDNRLVYSYSMMIESLIVSDEITDEEAIDFINYNTIRAIPYMGDKAPIILFDI